MTVDVTFLKNHANADPVLASIRRQIDIVVDARVKPEIAAFFRRIRAAVGTVPPQAGSGISYGESVLITAQPIAANRVVLLHELLHSYHHLALKGDPKRQLTRFFKEAAQAYRHAPNEYFLLNEYEFFAVTASIYLHGRIPRPPFSREAIRTAQPEYAQFLADLFDPPPTKPAKPTPAGEPSDKPGEPPPNSTPLIDPPQPRTNP